MLSTGWTIDYALDALTPTWLRAMRAHWRVYPPVHKMAAAFGGYKAPPEVVAMNENEPSVMLGRSILAGIDRAQGGPSAP